MFNTRPAVIATIAALSVAAVPSPIAAQATGDLAAVQKHLQSVETMTANFSQADRNGKVLTGVLTLKKPGKLRFQYEKGVPILIVAEGGALTFIDYSVKQVQRWPIKNSPLGVLLDPTRDITRYAKLVPGYDQRIVSVEANDPKHPEYGRITLVFVRNASAPGGLMLQGWVALDSQNNRTTIRLTNQKFGEPVSDNSFRWNDPRRTGVRK
ncbi:outer membrane lipoprotein-sorting protein [Sphingomonas sp. PP-CE-1A-559]|jgi:outer membrane lipoprotein-sorting protein|uniref:LolA family protein n=1 Tax=Sphingomonas sp. PP-CE-1A-559 TaxID=2135657 RepID=UPI001054F45A|nr:outer membrane lipoprotein carrier protein LolA [Sphingomonas sp. PP-CE-1A-559]TCP91555.1 outer membrane lipoprotein-sorting protein [Sphingomonas sp. PP-CE-1A-559]